MGINIEELDNLIYHPLENYESDKEDYTAGIDPDDNYFNSYHQSLLIPSNYMTESFFIDIGDDISKDTMSIVHLNIRSLPKNLSKFIELMTILKFQFDIIGFSETWLKPNNVDLYNLPGYNHEYSIRNVKTGGGIYYLLKISINTNPGQVLT